MNKKCILLLLCSIISTHSFSPLQAVRKKKKKNKLSVKKEKQKNIYSKLPRDIWKYNIVPYLGLSNDLQNFMLSSKKNRSFTKDFLYKLTPLVTKQEGVLNNPKNKELVALATKILYDKDGNSSIKEFDTCPMFSLNKKHHHLIAKNINNIENLLFKLHTAQSLVRHNHKKNFTRIINHVLDKLFHALEQGIINENNLFIRIPNNTRKLPLNCFYLLIQPALERDLKEKTNKHKKMLQQICEKARAKTYTSTKQWLIPIIQLFARQQNNQYKIQHINLLQFILQSYWKKLPILGKKEQFTNQELHKILHLKIPTHPALNTTAQQPQNATHSSDENTLAKQLLTNKTIRYQLNLKKIGNNKERENILLHLATNKHLSLQINYAMAIKKLLNRKKSQMQNIISPCPISTEVLQKAFYEAVKNNNVPFIVEIIKEAAIPALVKNQALKNAAVAGNDKIVKLLINDSDITDDIKKQVLVILFKKTAIKKHSQLKKLFSAKLKNEVLLSQAQRTFETRPLNTQTLISLLNDKDIASENKNLLFSDLIKELENKVTVKSNVFSAIITIIKNNPTPFMLNMALFAGMNETINMTELMFAALQTCTTILKQPLPNKKILDKLPSLEVINKILKWTKTTLSGLKNERVKKYNYLNTTILHMIQTEASSLQKKIKNFTKQAHNPTTIVDLLDNPNKKNKLLYKAALNEDKQQVKSLLAIFTFDKKNLETAANITRTEAIKKLLKKN